MSNKILGWHFIKPNKKERYEPYRNIVVGEKLTCDPEKLELCSYGLHASIKALDALVYVDWDDAFVCRVELSGKIIEGDDKICASERKVLWMKPADKILHRFACRCAYDVLPIFEKKYPNDKRPRKAIEAKLNWLEGKISNDELDEAWEEAWDAAWDSAWAARPAARVAARVATKDKYNSWLEEMLENDKECMFC